MSIQRCIINFQSDVQLFTLECKHMLCQKACEVASCSKHTNRKKWSEFIKFLSDPNFLRHFRMHKDCLKSYVIKLKLQLEKEDFLESLESFHILKKIKLMHSTHKSSTGGFVIDEIRLTITLDLLVGVSCMVLGLLYACG